MDKPSVVHYICYKKTDSYFTLWLNLELLVPVAIDCWVDNIRYNGISTTLFQLVAELVSTSLSTQDEFSVVKGLMASQSDSVQTDNIPVLKHCKGDVLVDVCCFLYWCEDEI